MQAPWHGCSAAKQPSGSAAFPLSFGEHQGTWENESSPGTKSFLPFAAGVFVFLLRHQTADVVLVHLSMLRSFDLNSNQQTNEGEVLLRGAFTCGQEGPSASLRTLGYVGFEEVCGNLLLLLQNAFFFGQGMSPLSIIQMCQSIFIFVFNSCSVLEVMTVQSHEGPPSSTPGLAPP